jgi:hypothetical protein
LAVQGWVFQARADESDPEEHLYSYEVAYVLEGSVRVFSQDRRIDPWDRVLSGPFGSWFHETVMQRRAATVLLHPEREPTLFGDTEPYELIALGDQLARARLASAAQRAKEVETAIEILQEAASADRPRVARLLAPFASTYTTRGHDEFYVVADLYEHARKGGDVLAILERIAPQLPEAKKAYWAAA